MDLTSISSFIHDYLDIVGTTPINIKFFIFASIICIILCALKYYIDYKSDLVNSFHLLENNLIILGISLIISYFCIILATYTGNPITGCIFGIILGFIGGNFIERKYLLDNEDKYSLDNKPSKDKSNNRDNEEEANEEQVEVEDFIFRNDSDNDKKEKLTQILNSHSENIKLALQQIEKIKDEIQIIKNSLMIQRRIEIESAIYKCLNQGFVEPHIHKKVISLFTDYEALGGNHGLKELYNQFLDLPVHDERRKRITDRDRDCK
jgi:hypothetical protein